MRGCIVLTKLKKKLKQQGYAVKPSKASLGFVSFKPINISIKSRKTKANTQHITVEDIEENSGLNSPPRISVFDQIEAPITRASSFTRLGNFNQVKRNSTHIS